MHQVAASFDGYDQIKRNLYELLFSCKGNWRSQSHIDQDMFILEAKENFGSKGAKEAQEVLGRVNSLFAGGELDEDAKDVFFQAIMSVYMDSKKTAREKYTPKKYRKHKDKE